MEKEDEVRVEGAGIHFFPDVGVLERGEVNKRRRKKKKRGKRKVRRTCFVLLFPKTAQPSCNLKEFPSFVETVLERLFGSAVVVV